MNILLAYSTHHFRPDDPEKSGRAGSAAVLAEAWYTLLSRFGEVEYVDGLHPPKVLKRDHYDLLVSILGGITPLCPLARFDKIILFAVNMHPIERNRILDDFNKNYRVCDAHTLDKSIVSLKVMDDIERADAIFLVGNETIRRSFIVNGIEPRRVFCLNYAAGLPLCAEAPSLMRHETALQGHRFVYVATEMCLRKGFDIIDELFSDAEERGEPFHLTVIGAFGSKGYAAKLARLKERLGTRISVEGWVSSDSEHYAELLKQNDLMIFPSLEEGQAGSVLDAIACGLIPVVTPQTGIDFSPLGYLSPELGSHDNRMILERALHLTQEEVVELQRQSLGYYATAHTPWREALRRTVEQFLEMPLPSDVDQQPEASNAPTRSSRLRHFLWGPIAFALQFLCPSKQKRKRLYNYYRLS